MNDHTAEGPYGSVPGGPDPLEASQPGARPTDPPSGEPGGVVPGGGGAGETPAAPDSGDGSPWWVGESGAAGGLPPGGFPSAPRGDETPTAVLLPEPGASPDPTRSPRLRRVAEFAVVALVAGAVGGVVAHAADGNSGGPVVTSAVATSVPTGSEVSPALTALHRIDPSVVIINDTISQPTPLGGGGFGFSPFFGGGTASAAGTGIVYSSNGLVFTNAHVVNGASNIQVTIPGRGTHPASVVGLNATEDVAVLKVAGVSGLTPATFADSAKVQVGDAVLAVGNAEGYGGKPSVAEGIISATGRTLQDQQDNIPNVFQTDAAINPGDSGGPLIDLAGQVVGIDTAVATGTTTEPAQGIGFAIPSSTFLAEARQIISSAAHGGSPSQTNPGATTNKGFLGVEVASTANGVVVAAVESGGPAAAAGVTAGDVITSVNGTPVSSASQLRTLVERHKPGQHVRLGVTDQAGSRTVTVTLGAAPASVVQG